MLRCLPNPHHGVPGLVVLPAGGYRRVKAEITAWPGYAPTPLRPMPALAEAAGVAAVCVKDESARFGLGGVEALGGAYAVADLALAELSRRGVRATMADLLAGQHDLGTLTVACVADGNHCRSVAWGARRVGARCCVLVPKGDQSGAESGLVAATRALGAELHMVSGCYEDAQHAMVDRAASSGWSIVSDRSWPGYTAVPLQIMQASRVMADEAADAWAGAPPTHAFIPARSGSVAAAVSVQLRARFDPAPRLIVVEADEPAGLFASAACGRMLEGSGAPSLLAWQELARAAFAFLAIGPAGDAWDAGFRAAAADPGARAALGLDRSSRVLLFRTAAAGE